MKRLAIVFVCSVLALSACATGGDEDEIGGDTTSQTDKADTVATTSTYFAARPDLRKCIAPLCGGYWVHRLNKSTTKCSDGTYHSECYVWDLDISGLGLTDDEQAVVTTEFLFRGDVSATDINGYHVGMLKVFEVWQPASGGTVPSGTFYRVDPNLIRCITTPCPTQYHEAKLDSTVSTTLVGFTGPFADKLAAIDHSVLAAGTNYAYSGGKKLKATQFYTRYQHQVPADLACTTDADCVLTHYPTDVTSSDDCYCAKCARSAINVDYFDQYADDWHASCDSKPLICPAILCMNVEAHCSAGQCVARPPAL